jgi:hypothetical protein
MYGSDNHDLLWNTVSGDHEVLQKRASLTHAKVAVAQYWPFLSRAADERDFENRLSLTLDRIAARVPAETYDDVIASLREDFSRLAGGKGENPFAKDDDPDNDEADNDDKDSKSKKSDDDSDDDDSDDKDSDSKSDSDDDDSDDDDDDDKPAFPKGKKSSSTNGPDEKDCPVCKGTGSDEGTDCQNCDSSGSVKKTSTNYRPDPTAGWRYHPGYEQLRQPVNNGDLQDGDGFVADLAQGEGRSNEVIEQRQLTPGVWTQHDGMPERPMPQGVQRGYMPVNASQHTAAGQGPNYDSSGTPSPYHYDEGYEHGFSGQEYKGYGGRPAAISYGAGYRHGKWDAGQDWGYAPKGERKKVKKAVFDKQGYLIESGMDFRKMINGSDSEERALDPHYNEVPEIRGTSRTKGTFDGPTGRELADAEKMKSHTSKLVFDDQGFVVSAAEGRGVDPLQDPVPGQPQKHNPFYFQDGSNVGGNNGFPSDPGPEPHMNNMDEIYGDVAPQSSSGSTQGTVDGDGYSRMGSLRYDAQGYRVESPNFT